MVTAWLPAMLVVPAGDGGFGLGLLGLVEREDRAAVLGADVVALAVELGRVVRAEEHVVDLGERDLVAGSKVTLIASAWPVLPEQTCL